MTILQQKKMRNASFTRWNLLKNQTKFHLLGLYAFRVNLIQSTQIKATLTARGGDKQDSSNHSLNSHTKSLHAEKPDQHHYGGYLASTGISQCYY